MESLKSSKFEAFRENELTNLFSIIGGLCYNTLGNDYFSDVTGVLTVRNAETGELLGGGNGKFDRFTGSCPQSVILAPDPGHPLMSVTTDEDPMMLYEAYMACEVPHL